MNEELFLKEQNEKFWGLSIRFLEGYVIEGSRWLKLYEDEGIEAGQINGHIAFLFREWLHYVDGIGVLFNSSNTYAARVLLRSAWEIFLQFKYFLDMAAKRYDQNNNFFMKMFSEPEMMEEIKNTIGAALYARLKPKKKVYYMETEDNSLMAAENQEEFNKK